MLSGLCQTRSERTRAVNWEDQRPRAYRVGRKPHSSSDNSAARGTGQTAGIAAGPAVLIRTGLVLRGRGLFPKPVVGIEISRPESQNLGPGAIVSPAADRPRRYNRPVPCSSAGEETTRVIRELGRPRLVGRVFAAPCYRRMDHSGSLEWTPKGLARPRHRGGYASKTYPWPARAELFSGSSHRAISKRYFAMPSLFCSTPPRTRKDNQRA